jgi:hypothetical protein
MTSIVLNIADILKQVDNDLVMFDRVLAIVTIRLGRSSTTNQNTEVPEKRPVMSQTAPVAPIEKAKEAKPKKEGGNTSEARKLPEDYGLKVHLLKRPTGVTDDDWKVVVDKRRTRRKENHDRRVAEQIEAARVRKERRVKAHEARTAAQKAKSSKPGSLRSIMERFDAGRRALEDTMKRIDVEMRKDTQTNTTDTFTSVRLALTEIRSFTPARMRVGPSAYRTVPPSVPRGKNELAWRNAGGLEGEVVKYYGNFIALAAQVNRELAEHFHELTSVGQRTTKSKGQAPTTPFRR